LECKDIKKKFYGNIDLVIGDKEFIGNNNNNKIFSPLKKKKNLKILLFMKIKMINKLYQIKILKILK